MRLALKPIQEALPQQQRVRRRHHVSQQQQLRVAQSGNVHAVLDTAVITRYIRQNLSRERQIQLRHWGWGRVGIRLPFPTIQLRIYII